jgi:hypothetical protein
MGMCVNLLSVFSAGTGYLLHPAERVRNFDADKSWLVPMDRSDCTVAKRRSPELSCRGAAPTVRFARRPFAVKGDP